MKTTLIILRAMAIAILLIVFCLGLISFTAEAETGISQLLWTGGWMLVVVLSAKGLERLGAIKDDRIRNMASSDARSGGSFDRVGMRQAISSTCAGSDSLAPHKQSKKSMI